MWLKSKLISIAIIIVLLEGSALSCVVRPSKYYLNLETKIHEGNLNFSATAKIHITLTEIVNELSLNVGNLDIQTIDILNSDGTEEVEKNISHEKDEVNEVVVLSVKQLIKDTSYILHISYTGILHRRFIEVIESSESNFQLASLTFRSTKFRHLCPSFDEDHFRSVFEIEIQHHKTYNVISNSDQIRHFKTVNLDDFVVTKFYPTEALPTTSIAIVISKFVSFSFTDTEKIEIYGTKDLFNINFVRATFNQTICVIKSFNNYFKAVHEITSLKIVIIPDIISPIPTFQLIIFNQYNFVYHPERMAIAQKEKMLRLMTQAFSQQFFGIMTSAHETFITDGFARFYEYFFAEMLQPNNHIRDIYNTEILMVALEIDSFPSTDEILKIEGDELNQLASSKFCDLLRMYEEIIGPEIFQEKVLEFLQKYKFSSLSIENFYEDFIKEAEDDINWKKIFHTWIENTGYPVIDVSLIDSKLLIVQGRFEILSIETEDIRSQQWIIPLSYYTSENSKKSTIFLSETFEMSFSENDWIIFNTGFYRVNYDDGLWRKLISQLKSSDYTKIQVLNRAALVDDSMNLALSGKISYKFVFEILSYLRNEFELIPWEAASLGLEYIDMKLSSDLDVYEKFKQFVINLVEPIYQQFSVTKIFESAHDNKLREIAMFWMCKMKDLSCLNFVKAKYLEFIQNPIKLLPDLTFPVLCNAIRDANFEESSKLIQIMLNYDDDRDPLIKSLACTEDFETFLNLIDIYSNNKLPFRDRRTLLIAIIKNYKYGIEAVDKLYRRHSLLFDKSDVNFMINAMVKRIWSEEYLELFKNILNDMRTADAISKEKENIYIMMGDKSFHWTENGREEIFSWLNEYILEFPVTTSTELGDDRFSTETESTETTQVTTPSGVKALYNDKLWFRIILVLLNISIINSIKYILKQVKNSL